MQRLHKVLSPRNVQVHWLCDPGRDRTNNAKKQSFTWLLHTWQQGGLLSPSALSLHQFSALLPPALHL